MRVARPVVPFGVGFLRNAFLRLQSNVKKFLWQAVLAGGPRPHHAIPALVTTDPEGGVSGTSPGLGGCTEGTAGRAFSCGPENNHMCNFFLLLWPLQS